MDANHSNAEAPIFFWLNLEDKLDPLFYSASKHLSYLGIQLLPVRPDQISRLAALTEASHLILICSTRRQGEQVAFLRKVLPFLNLLLKQERLSLFHLSSFHKPETGPRISRHENYFFFKYPLNLESVCAKLKKFHGLKVSQAQKWPGGKRSKVPGLAA